MKGLQSESKKGNNFRLTAKTIHYHISLVAGPVPPLKMLLLFLLFAACLNLSKNSN